MAKKPTVNNVGSGYDIQNTINQNFKRVSDAFENTLSLDGSTPNKMLSDLDLNGNDVLNGGNLDVVSLSIEGVPVKEDILQNLQEVRDLTEETRLNSLEVETNTSIVSDFKDRAEIAAQEASDASDYVASVYPTIISAGDTSVAKAQEAEGYADAASLDAASAEASMLQAGVYADVATSAAGPLQGGLAGQLLRKVTGDDYDYTWATISGAGDMVASLYDPQGVQTDAFARGNHTGTQAISTIENLEDTLGNRVRFDAAQTLTTAQKTQTLSNIGGQSALSLPSQAEVETGTATTARSWNALRDRQGAMKAVDLSAVRFDNAQTLTAAQKAQARENIDAAPTHPTAGAVGSFVLAAFDQETVAYGSTVNGASLQPAGSIQRLQILGMSGGTIISGVGSQLSGTWVCLGESVQLNTAGSVTGYFATLFRRIA